jgi:hypothetical protein
MATGDPNNPSPVRRKTAPLARATGWPGYMTFVNDSVSNIGQYWFRFYDFPGFDLTSYPLNLLGLRWGNTSFTYEQSPPVGFVWSSTNMSTRIDTLSAPIKGTHVIGDPMREWNLGFPSGPVIGPVGGGPDE